jgi:NAD(P)-dependent dehydrogenase (short-subunit alcohol dehydrogenase family)
MRRVLITGANRGIGLELVRQCLGRGDRVFAACRAPQQAAQLKALGGAERLTVVAMEVADEQSIRAACEAVRSQTDGLDVLINNAGIYKKGRDGLSTFEVVEMLEVFRVNSIGPLVVVREFLDLLRKGNAPKVANVSSEMGSIGRKHNGSEYGYSASKAALNMISRLLSFDLRRDGIAVVTFLHPGWVKTDMGGRGAPLEPEVSVRGMLAVIDSLTLADSGRFLQWDGQELPW